jgi:hypothetical protein
LDPVRVEELGPQLVMIRVAVHLEREVVPDVADWNRLDELGDRDHLAVDPRPKPESSTAICVLSSER